MMRTRFFKNGCMYLLIGLFVLSLSPMGGLSSALAARDHVVVQTWGGKLGEAQQKAFFDPFTAATGIKVIGVETGVSVPGKLAAMQRSNNIEWDIVTGNYAPYTQMFFDKGFTAEIDYDIVTETADLVPGSAQKWGVAQYLEGVCLVYNTNVFPEGKQPKNYADFFDVENFPGARAMANWGAPAANLAIALMADGAAPDDIMPIDFDKAFTLMDKIKPHVKLWYTSGAQLVQSLLDEEVVLAIATDGRAKSAISMGAPIKIEWHQSFYFLAYNAVVKNSPMENAAMKLLNLCNHPKQQAIFTEIIGYTGSNIEAVQYMPKAIQKDQSTHPDNFGKVFNFMTIKNAAWSVDNMAMIDEQWNNWLAK